MLSVTDLRGRVLDARTLREVMPRAELDVEAALDVVRPILAEVEARGSAAALDFGERFDGVRPPLLRVPADVLAAAVQALDLDVRAALEVAIARTRQVHADQRPQDVTTRVADGAQITNRWIPVRRVGLYVPGGLAVYPSSVVMNVVPAQAAGVASLVVVSPPQRDNVGVFTGYPHPTVLAACVLLGVDEVYAVGGAQAVALLAYGSAADEASKTAAIEPVSLITGPGNVYVTSAKRLVQGVVGIDAEAGPSEIAILADDSADPEHVAADLISQAEHGPTSGSVLVTDSADLADRVADVVARRVSATKHAERVRIALSGKQSGVFLVDDLAAGVQVVDAYAAEHLEIQTRDAGQVAGRISNAGAIFLGAHSPVSLGDYCAGSNHVLPTEGTAAHTSGLSTRSFLKEVQVIDYSEAALAQVARHVVNLSHSEDLPGHGEAVTARFGDEVPV